MNLKELIIFCSFSYRKYIRGYYNLHLPQLNDIYISDTIIEEIKIYENVIDNSYLKNELFGSPYYKTIERFIKMTNFVTTPDLNQIKGLNLIKNVFLNNNAEIKIYNMRSCILVKERINKPTNYYNINDEDINDEDIFYLSSDSDNYNPDSGLELSEELEELSEELLEEFSEVFKDI